MYYVFNRATGTLVTKIRSQEMLKCFPSEKYEVIQFDWNTNGD